MWVVLSETGIRQSTLHAFDLDDYDAEERYIAAVNREETGTRLKNGYDGEREISISKDAARAIDGYIEANRNSVTDEHGREPLLTTRNGRLQKSTIRQYVYAWSRPCAIGRECPHDRDPDDCEAANNEARAARCPSSVTPHPIRRGYITQLLRAGVPVEVVSDRCNVSPTIIDQHYDVRSKEDKMKQRQEALDDVDGHGSSYT